MSTVSAETLNAAYNITSEEANALKRLIGGMQDDEELKQHLLQISLEAYTVQFPNTFFFCAVVLFHLRLSPTCALVHLNLRGNLKLTYRVP